jgi:hypothetical protein
MLVVIKKPFLLVEKGFLVLHVFFLCYVLFR